MKTPFSRSAWRIHGKRLATISALALVASMTLSTANATPPFPLRVSRPPAPTRVELAPPLFGKTQTDWRMWPGQAESLAQARAQRERRRAEIRRKVMDAHKRDEDARDQDELLDSLQPPTDLGNGSEQPGTGDADSMEGLFDTTPSGPPTTGTAPSADEAPRLPPQDSGPTTPPAAPDLGTSDTEDEDDSLTLPGPSDGARLKRPGTTWAGRDGQNHAPKRTAMVPQGVWRSAGSRFTSAAPVANMPVVNTRISAQPIPRPVLDTPVDMPIASLPKKRLPMKSWDRAANSRQPVMPASHRNVRKSLAPAEPKWINFPIDARSMDGTDKSTSNGSGRSNIRLAQHTAPVQTRATTTTSYLSGSGWTAASKRSTRSRQ